MPCILSNLFYSSPVVENNDGLKTTVPSVTKTFRSPLQSVCTGQCKEGNTLNTAQKLTSIPGKTFKTVQKLPPIPGNNDGLFYCFI